jgi:hypothetical protein
MHALQVKHLKVKDRIKKLQAMAASIEADAIEAGLAERKPTTIEEFRWPKDDVIKKWGADIWTAFFTAVDDWIFAVKTPFGYWEGIATYQADD